MTTATNPLQVFRLCDDKTFRFEHVIYLAACLPSYDGGNIPTPLELFMENNVETIAEAFPNGLPAHLVDCDDDDDDFSTLLIDWMIESSIGGFLVNAATPVMDKKENSTAYSWGVYWTKWIYAETMDEAITRSAAWVDTMREKEAAEA